jgi:microcystin-dependent protein
VGTLYRNFLSGTTTDNPLTNVATTVNGSAFSGLPEITAPDFMWLVLDPEGDDGAPEIVKITAHTALATSVTVERAQQNTSARQHDSGTTWHASPVTRTDAEEWLKTVAEANIAAGAVTLSKLATAVQNLLVPAGTIRATVKTTADDGWLLFNQTVVGAQSAYPALWAVAPAGWKSGSDLVLPNVDDSVLMDAGSVASLGTVDGANTATLAEANLPAHVHTIDHNHASATTSSDGAHTHTTAIQSVGFKDGSGADTTRMQAGSTTATSSDGAHTHTLDLPNFTGNSGSVGSGTAFSIAQKRLGVVFQIKAH